MRKAQKKQILEIIDSLQQAHEEIGKALQKKGSDPMQSQTVSRMLGECQETAVSIGESIEKTEGEKHITVSYLEEYCELLFRIHEEISGGNNNNNKICKSLRKQLIKIENSVKNDISVRKEIVFFPYKASMWDSLESVYLAAREDPDCDAYCVPIPYYDLKPDRSFGEMHYEGGVDADGIPVMYPKNIEITDWQAYKFEERRPDAIYIHNGYDKWNLVTSVHPRFYAENLKKYTDKLVYIPYFMLGEIEPDDQTAIDGMKHFCFMPGTIYADRVVVQSEKMRQIYINEYIKAAKETGLGREHVDRQFLEKKFLGLGSPKLDKVRNTRKEELEIPAEWLKIIEKPDGSWKRIVFYNTSVSALLHNDEKMLQKMAYVFQIFRENQDEVALLWRPHPLIQATIASMRPQLWEAYEALKDKYIEEGWGIYDDTADVERAIVLSDAYYGDASSIVKMYRETGKLIMMQDVEILKPVRYEYDIASTEAICSYQGNYYFVFMRYPALCRMNRDTMECEMLYWFQEKKLFQRLYRKIVPYQNRLFLVPFLSDQIAIYDIESEELQFIALKEDYVDVRWQEELVSSKFEDALVQGKFLYMIPHCYHALIKMDMENLTVEEIPLGKRGAKIFCYCLGNACLVENKILFPINGDENICIFHIDTNMIERVYPSGEKKKYISIFLIENRLWMIPEKLYDGIDIWDIDSRTIRQTLMLSDEIKQMSRQNETVDVRQGFKMNGTLYLLPYGFEYGVTIVLDSGKADLWKLPYEYKKEDFPLYQYYLRYASILQEGRYTVICGLHGEWMVCEQNGAYVLDRQSTRDSDLLMALFNIKAEDIISERRLDLGEYIKLRMETSNVLEKGNKGQCIYRYISAQGG